MPTPSTMLPLGTPAPDFELRDYNGNRIRLSESSTAPATVVLFLSNHCPYVQHIADVLGDLTRELIDRGVAVYGINSNDDTAYPDDSPERMAEEAAIHGYAFPYLVDSTQEVAHAYSAACTPDFFVFDRLRLLAYRGQFDGSRPSNEIPVTGSDLLAAVEALLAGRAVDPEQSPSLGCGIKWFAGNEPS